MNTLTIRQAVPILDDAIVVHDLERRTLGDSDYTAEEMLAVLHRPEHRLYLAYDQGVPAGFCSCFETAEHGEKRLEVDLLGVAAKYRNQGIARSLIGRAISEAREQGITLFRGVVKTDNIASQKAFAHAGLERSAQVYDLTVYLIQGREPLSWVEDGWAWRYSEERALKAAQRASGNMHKQRAVGTLVQDGAVVGRVETLHVSTLTYRGMWVERIEAGVPRLEQFMARALVEEAKVLDLDEVGYLMPRSTPDQARLVWLREGYQEIGAYYQYR